MTSRSRLREAMAPGENGRPPILSPNMIKSSLGDVSCNAAARFLESLGTTTPGDGLDSVINPDIRKLFERDLAIYRHIFGRIGINMPTPAELAQADIDFGRLAELKETRPNHALVVAPLVMSLEKTGKLISEVAHDPYLQEKCTATGINSNELGVFYAVVESWDQIVRDTAANWQLPTTNDDNKWTAFLMPCGDEPEHLNISHDEMKRQNKTTMPLIGYIAYQTHRIYHGKQPIDSETLSLAADEFIHVISERRVVPTIRWSVRDECLEINCTRLDSTKDNMGIRPPIG